MPKFCNSVEQELQAKSLTAPRIRREDIEANIASEHYFTAGDGFAGAMALTAMFSSKPESERVIAPPEQLDLLTFCVLILNNGYTVTGESACVSPENFDAELGKKIARENAVNKIWPLMGYELKERLSKA